MSRNLRGMQLYNDLRTRLQHDVPAWADSNSHNPDTYRIMAHQMAQYLVSELSDMDLYNISDHYTEFRDLPNSFHMSVKSTDDVIRQNIVDHVVEEH